MTKKIYTAGEHVRIIKADPGFNDELGEKQIGLVGTVTTGTDSGGAYIKFPHHDSNLFFLSSELEPVTGTPAPEPEKNYLFREGDTVRYIGNNADWKGSEFTVNGDVESSPYITTVGLTTIKVPDTLKSLGYRVGYKVALSTNTVEKFTPAPEPKFKSGDWVKVTGRNDEYDGIVGQIEQKAWRDFWEVIDTGGEKYSFAEDKLELTEAPYVPKFKTGDWVKVIAYPSWNGTIGQVVKESGAHDPLTRIKVHGKTSTGVFFDKEIELTDKPADPHWTETTPIHSAVRVDGRTVVKLEEDKWLFMYHSGDQTEKVTHVVYRDGNEAKKLLSKEPEVTVPVNS